MLPRRSQYWLALWRYEHSLSPGRPIAVRRIGGAEALRSFLLKRELAAIILPMPAKIH